MKIMGSNEFTDNTMSDPVSLDTGLAHNTVTKEVGYGNQTEEAPSAEDGGTNSEPKELAERWSAPTKRSG